MLVRLFADGAGDRFVDVLAATESAAARATASAQEARLSDLEHSLISTYGAHAGEVKDLAVASATPGFGSGLRRGDPSRTAMMAATARGAHRLEDPPPWVFDDPYALSLVGPAWPDLLGSVRQVLREPVHRQALAGQLARSRYAEDRLTDYFSQYVILGAGLDSFAWRRPDLLNFLRVFEVDHPATQEWKRQRAAALALPTSDRHVFAPIDFQTANLREGLTAPGFDWTQRTLYSWLGVTAYLPIDAIEATLRTVATGASGSEIVMSYAVTKPFLDDLGREFVEVIGEVAEQAGELLGTFFAPGDAEGLVRRCGLSMVDHVGRDELHRRYFAGRTDGLTPYTVERLLTAVV
jgi:methyltransferase (TIGR00027 family)